VERQDGRIGDEGDPASDLETGELGARATEKAPADENAVRAWAQTDGDFDHDGFTTTMMASRRGGYQLLR
jgi:hypothetical protein